MFALNKLNKIKGKIKKLKKNNNSKILSIKQKNMSNANKITNKFLLNQDLINIIQ